MINDSGITKKEQEQHPQTIVDIVGFYKENAEKSGEEVWDKFEHAKAPDLRVGTSAPPLNSPGLLNTPMSYGSVTPMMSPPASPRFPSNHETSFENPRSPPPVPGMGPTLQPKDVNGMIPTRPAPRPPVAAPARPAPPPPSAGKDSGIGMRQSDDLPALAYIPPSQDSSVVLPEEHLSRSNSRANGTSPFASPVQVASPQVLYQQQLMQQQQDHENSQLQNPQLSRAPSQRQQPQQSPPIPPKGQFQQIQPPNLNGIPHPSQQVRAQPGARPRNRPRQSTGFDIVARLKGLDGRNTYSQIESHTTSKLARMFELMG